jgi:predicted permease
MLDAVVPPTLPPTERANLRDSIPYLQRMGTGLSTNRQRYSEALRLILLLTSLLLLLACINLGGLLLLRWDARSSEVAVRLALGGARWRLARQLVIESLFLSLTGVALAIPIAQAVVVVLASMMPPANVPYTMSFAPDATVLAAATGVGVLTGVLMSAVPLSIALRQPAPLHLHSERTIAGSSNAWSRGMLVAQVALSIVMLICASLLTRSLYLLQNADLGVRAEGIVDIKLYTLPDVPYARGQRDAYYPPLLDQVAALPSVHAAALAEVFPRGRSTAGTAIAFAGSDENDVTATTDRISPGFFETMGILLRAGRTLQWSDTLNTRQVAVVSESLARALSPDGDVLDRHVRFGSLPVDQDIVIVGVAADATQGDPRNAKPRVLYRPILQAPVINASNPNLLVATSDAAGVVAAVRGLLAQAGQHYVQEVIGVDDVLARAPWSERMSALLAGAVGGLAVLIAIVGIYGTFAYSVSRRKREIGVRVAIGAAPRTVARSVLRDAALVALGGVAIALPLAYIAARALETLMFGITESDPITFLGSSLLFLALAMAAAIVPARRAASVDPAQALRGD